MIKTTYKTIFFASILLFTISCSKKSFNSENEFLNYFEKKGYYCIGLYADAWPAEIIPEKTYNDEYVMSMNPNITLSYTGFEDMDLKLVVIQDNNKKKGLAGFLIKTIPFSRIRMLIQILFHITNC